MKKIGRTIQSGGDKGRQCGKAEWNRTVDVALVEVFLKKIF